MNNAGILRDRVLVNLSEEDWDSVIDVHLKGHFVPTRHAANYWREEAKDGNPVKAAIINTSSTSGLLGNIGQSNYGAAKAGIAAFTVIIAEELGRYGVRANAIAPAARTRMTESTPGLSDHVVAPSDASVFDTWDPANISPLVAWLAMEDCDITGQVFFVQGGDRAKVPELDDDRDAREERPLVGGRAGRATAHAVAVSDERRRGARRSRRRRRAAQRAHRSRRGRLRHARHRGGQRPQLVLAAAPTRVQARAEGSSRYQWWVLWSLLAGLFALNFTFTVFIVALPTVAAQFHTSVTVLTWTMVGPLLAYGLAAPILGKTGDIFGHRRLYLFGLLGAMVSALLTALAHNVDMLLFARTLDGVQGAATGTASGALINSVFGREERVKAMGWWSLVGAGGPVIGVSLGAPIIAAFGWRALFWFQLVLIVARLRRRLDRAAASAEDSITKRPRRKAQARTRVQGDGLGRAVGRSRSP